MKNFKTKALQVLEQEKKNIERYINNLKEWIVNWNNFKKLNVKVLEKNVWMAENISYSLANINTPDVIVYQTIINCIDRPGIKPFSPEELMELWEYCYKKINEKS